MRQSSEDRKRAVEAITRRNMLERRIKRTQRRMASLQGETRQALEDNLMADQAALAEATQAAEALKAEVLKQIKADMRRKSEEALRLRAEWERSRFLHTFPNGSVPSSPDPTLGFLMLLAAMAAVAGGVLLLNR